MIRIICIGKLKEPHYAQAAAEYIKRLGRYGKVDVVEFKECTDKNPEVSKRNEAQLILKRLSESYTVVLDRKGKQMTSEGFSTLLDKTELRFILGGPDGLSKEVLEGADTVLSLSDMTLPHQLARVVLLEQIYRGFTILKGEKYHK
jgi:23S rRNA (pseudouridine1915-N3)-methyltransferase